MNLKKKLIDGVCSANRCKTPAQVAGDNPYGLCAQHWNEWTVDGRRDLAAKTPSTALAKTPAANDLEAVKAEIEPVRSSAEEMLRFVALVPFDAQVQIAEGGAPMSGLQALGQLRETARLQLKAVEEKRTSITKPILAAKRAADALFEPLKDACEAIIKTSTERLRDYAKAQEAAQQAALAQVNLGERDAQVLVVAHGQTAAPLPEQVKAEVWFRFEVVDISLVPREFLMLDEKLTQQYVDAKKGQCTIPGLRVWQDMKVRTA